MFFHLKKRDEGKARRDEGWEGQCCPFLHITEARSEGLIELKLVRKPPKVSRGYGGVARAGAAPAVPGSPRSGLPHRI